MKAKICLGCYLFLLGYYGSAFAQSDIRITSPTANITAGDHIEFALTLSNPAPCDDDVYVAFVSSDNNVSFTANGRVAKGGEAVTLKVGVPRDIKASQYTARQGWLNACPEYSLRSDFTVSPITVTVKGLSESAPISQSAGADLSISLTLKQFLDTKIAELDDLDSQLSTRLAQGASDTPELRSFLIHILESADHALSATADQYRKHIMKSGEILPAFFADFHFQYRKRIDELRTPIRGIPASDGQAAKLVYVQGNKVDNSIQVAQMTTFPWNANGVQMLIRDNKAAYKYYKETGRITFTLEVTSVPTGAKIFCKKLIDDDFKPYSEPTDVTIETLELATWDFMFVRDGCKDHVPWRVDPYEDPNPHISVRFKMCKNR